MSTIIRPIPKVYDYLGNKKSELHSAYSITEGGEYGSVPDLSFKYPYYLLDGNGNVVYDDEGQKIIDPRIYTLQNEYMVEFNNSFYVIKYVEEGRDNDNKKTISVQCKGKLVDLSYKQIPYINLSPPINPAVDAKRAILEVITYSYQVELGYGYFTAVSGATVTLPTSVGSFDYTGYKIVTLDGAGKYQQRKIISYNIGTRVATLESAFSPVVNTTTLFRVHNSKYDLGFVDPLLINDGVNNIFRALKFEDTTILDALNTIALRFVGNLGFDTVFNSTYNEFRTEVKLTLPNDYNNYEFRYQKNIKGLYRIVDSTNGCYTRVYPEGRNNLSITQVATSLRTDPTPIGTETYAEHTLGKGDIFNFKYYLAQGYTLDQCKDLFVKDFQFIEDAYTDGDMLFDGAKKALEELSLPKVTYEINGVDLNVVFPNINPISLSVGDTVRVVDNDLGFNFFATITTLVRDWDVPYKPRISLSNIVDSLGDIYYKILKYNEAYTSRKSLYGKGVSVVIADQATSRNWRYADYIVPIDGTKTATQVIQAAIDEVSNQGGGTVVLSDGTYGLTATLAVKDNVIIIGSGSATKLYPINTNLSLCFTMSSRKNVVVSSLSIEPKMDGTTVLASFDNGIGVYSNSDNITVEQVIFETITSNYLIGIESSNLLVKNNLFKSSFNNVFPSDVIDLKACSNATVDSNTIYGLMNVVNGYISVVNQVGISDGEFLIRNNYINVNGEFNYFSSLNGDFINVNLNGDAVAVVENNVLINSGGNSLRSGINTNNTVAYKVSNNAIFMNMTAAGILVGSESNTVAFITNGDIINNTIQCAFLSNELIVNGSGIRVRGNVNGANLQSNNVKRINPYYPSITTLEYGVEVGTGATNTVVANNILNNSGQVSSFLNNGTGTLTLGGNKL